MFEKWKNLFITVILGFQFIFFPILNHWTQNIFKDKSFCSSFEYQGFPKCLFCPTLSRFLNLFVEFFGGLRGAFKIKK